MLFSLNKPQKPKVIVLKMAQIVTIKLIYYHNDVHRYLCAQIAKILKLMNKQRQNPGYCGNE